MMKKLKIALVLMVMMLGVAFYVPTVQAEETTEPTTEEVTTAEDVAEVDLDLTDIDATIESVKIYVIAVILSLISQLLSSGVSSVFLNKSKNKIFDFINKAKDENKISQESATKLTAQTNQVFNKVETIVDDLSNKFDDKMDTMSEEIKESVDGFSNLTSAFTQALVEYVTSDEDD